ncbi:hypothetical protein AGMMS49975_21570 [Clostridia bacterium]|nr:hypothetical protein AGMMS49975_21570 [Clostridia bacterium]
MNAKIYAESEECLMNYKIARIQTIVKFMESLRLNNLYSRPTLKHIEEFLKSSAIKGYNGKVTDIAEYSKNHRTTIGYFLNKGKWDDKVLEENIKSKVVEVISEQHKINENPVFVSVDDTVNPKKKPSSKAKAPIESADFHYSHLLGKTVWGHQVISTMMSCGDVSLNFDLCHYDKSKSKIDSVVEMASTLPVYETSSYALFDSWFCCKKVIDAFEKQGYYCTGALKTNRIIYPKGVRISINEFAEKYIEINDVSLVTVNSKSYYVYRYEGALNDIPNAVVLI